MSDRDERIKEDLKKLPEKPGVYLMHNKNDEVIYVGKAVILKNRVRQYFQSSKGKTEKIKKMVSHIDWFEYIVTDSELEALVLECNLIKEYRPRYNTMLMDDKAYPFICVTADEKFPKVYMVHHMKKDKNRYFGPYTSMGAVKDTLELIHKLYKIRTCNRVLPRDCGKERPCLNFHMGQCLAPCRGIDDGGEYKKNIDGILRFLGGDHAFLTCELTEKMMKASEDMDFEAAIRYRDLIGSVKHIAEGQKITDTNDQEDRDIIGLAQEGREAVAQVFFVRDGKILGRDHFRLGISEDDTTADILESFIKQFYSGTPFIPREIMLTTELPDAEAISAWLTEKRGKKVSIHVPKRGNKEKLLDLAVRNAKMILDQDKEKVRREELKTLGAVHEIEKLTGIEGIHRIEAYDISNISGFESVGSMVVFYNGKPKKNDYRKFRIRTVSGPNDYASMEEVLTRRFSHGLEDQEKKAEDESFSGAFESFPDVILMDGGKGQVYIAERVLASLDLSIPVCGMVKDDHHNTRGLYYHDEELPIDRYSEGFHLITRVQDEAHRFAITYHRGLRSKDAVKSVLSDIPGVGEKREKALMRHFENMDEIRAASVEDIASIDEFNLKAAQAVYDYLHAPEKGV